MKIATITNTRIILQQLRITSVVVFLATGVLSERAPAALTLTINEATPDRVSLRISGVFDADVVGDQKQWLAIKADWIDNVGVNFDWIDDSVGYGEFSSRPGVTIAEDSIAFSDFSIVNRVIAATDPWELNSVLYPIPWGDSIYYAVNGPITAGTSVSGTLTLTGSNLFDFGNVETLQLVSGYSTGQEDWVRLEAASMVPEPTTAALFGGGLLGLFVFRRRIAKVPQPARSEAGLRQRPPD